MERNTKSNRKIKILVKNGVKTIVLSVGIIALSVLIFGILLRKKIGLLN